MPNDMAAARAAVTPEMRAASLAAARAARAPVLELESTVGHAAKRETFAQHIANGHTAASALKAMGVSSKSKSSWDLAKDPLTVKRVQELVAQRLAAAGITAERTKHEIARVAYADVRRIFDDEGRLKPIADIDDDTAAAITSITVQRRNIGTMKEPEFVDVMKIKFASKMDALGLLAKHFKIVNDEGDGVNALANALADRLNQAARRAPAQPVEDVEHRMVVDSEPELEVSAEDLFEDENAQFIPEAEDEEQIF